jgi:arylsulfatase A-like enzyme
MSYRLFTSTFGLISLSAVALEMIGSAAVSARTGDTARPVKRPNFILIMADDMGYGDVGCFGNTIIKTPHLDRLAAEGMLLGDYHSNGAVSTPTRCALLTGRYQQRAGLEGVLLAGNERHERAGLQPGETTFADVLSANGYKTALIGKWHLGRMIRYNPVNHGFETFTGFTSGNVDYKSFVNNQGVYDWWNKDSLEQVAGYLTEVITRSGLDFIERNKKNAFCLYLAHGCPHSPYQGPDDPPFRVLGKKGLFESSRKDRNVCYREMIEYMDKGIGQIMDKLKREGLDKNTFVVFVSDNGPAGPGSSGQLRGKKGDLFEGGHRVPGILWMPGVIKAGSVCNQPVASMDFFSTMLELAEIPAGMLKKPLDGYSIVPLMRGNQTPNRYLFWRSGNAKAARYGDWKYLEITSGKGNNRQKETFLFNLKKDIPEKDNLIKEYPEKALELQNELNLWENSVDSETKEQTNDAGRLEAVPVTIPVRYKASPAR